MKIVPLGDKVVVARMEALETTRGGIVLPDASRDRPNEGRILSVGDGPLLPDGRHAPLQVHEGDRILFASYAGTEIQFDGQAALILNEADILAVIS